MIRASRIPTALAMLACVALVLPPSIKANEFRPTQNGLDVCLQADGTLAGQVVDSTGAPLAATTIALVRDRTVVTSCQSDQSGQFKTQRVEAGVYLLVYKEQTTLCRAWPSTSAPPVAQTDLRLVADDLVVRGQSRRGFTSGNSLLWVAVVATAIAVPLALAFPKHSSS